MNHMMSQHNYIDLCNHTKSELVSKVTNVFDVSVCFGLGQHSHFRLMLPLPGGTSFASVDHTLLKSKVRAALSQAVSVAASRIGSLHVIKINVKLQMS